MVKKKQTQADTAAQELCRAVATAMLDKKAQNVVSLDLSSIDGAISTYFVVCNAESTTQVDAIARNVEEHVRKTLGQKPRRVEGTENSLWILMDYVDVLVHIFQTEMREFYRIEQLWADAALELHTDEPPVVKKTTAVKKVAATAKKTAAEPTKKAAAATKKVAAKTTKVAGEEVKKTVAKKATVKASATSKKTVSAKASTATKKATEAKPAAKKPVVKKTVTKKVAEAKPAAKKTAAKKVTAAKPAAKKTSTKTAK